MLCFQCGRYLILMIKCVLHVYWQDVVLSTQVNDMVKVR